jgi:maleate cis-trans isomerase
METEIPAVLRAREAVAPERFTFHSSRMRMQKVTEEELEAMDRDSVGVSILAPYMKPLANLVIDYIENEGIAVIDSIPLEIPDNLEVGRQDARAPVEITKKLNTEERRLDGRFRMRCRCRRCRRFSPSKTARGCRSCRRR